jgi:hypothetical protein
MRCPLRPRNSAWTEDPGSSRGRGRLAFVVLYDASVLRPLRRFGRQDGPHRIHPLAASCLALVKVTGSEVVPSFVELEVTVPA